MKILSIHIHSHETGVVLMRDNEILYAIANERLSRKKIDARVPLLALKNCLEVNNISPAQIDQVVIVGKPLHRAWKDYIRESLLPIFVTHGRYLFQLIRSPWSFFRCLIVSLGIPSFLYRQFFPTLRIRWLMRGYKGKYSYYPHHYSHLASAYWASGWRDCLVACIEGAAFHQTMSVYAVRDNKWELLMESEMPHSAGRFYEWITRILGFDRIRHAGKITGLAAYGDPEVAYNKVAPLLQVKKGKLKLDCKLQYEHIVYFMVHKKIPPYFEGFSREDLAAAFQKRLEECIVEIIRDLAKKTGLRKIALAGGVTGNVKMNQRIHEIPEIDEIFIQPAMSDGGLALGAAFHKANQAGFKNFKFKNVYLGPEYGNKIIKKELDEGGWAYQYEEDIEKKVAQLLAAGKIVARFNSRMEFGPRALGNRSILYQATDPTVNDWLNKRLKRTEFMPFAPTTLVEYANKCYKNIKGAERTAKFMNITFDCTEYMKKVSPAAVHIDGTARPQLLSKEDNLSCYKILKEYFKLTGIPTVVNTSFNMHGEPIVCTPEDALRSFKASKLDYLALENYLIKSDG